MFDIGGACFTCSLTSTKSYEQRWRNRPKKSSKIQQVSRFPWKAYVSKIFLVDVPPVTGEDRGASCRDNACRHTGTGVGRRHCRPILKRGREAGVCSCSAPRTNPLSSAGYTHGGRVPPCTKTKRLQRPRSISISQSHRFPLVPEQQWQHPRVVDSPCHCIWVHEDGLATRLERVQ
jgi:hypothetical protein